MTRAPATPNLNALETLVASLNHRPLAELIMQATANWHNVCFPPIADIRQKTITLGMKRGNGLARAVALMSRHDLGGLPTGALLARMKRLRWCEESRENSDLSLKEVASVSHLILFKDDPEWRAAYTDLKAVLAEREHVENKP